MKASYKHGYLMVAALVAIAAFAIAPSAQAATLEWDVGLAATDYFALGGTGTWDLSTANWFNGVDTDVVWTNGNKAKFGSPAGTVTLNNAVTLSDLEFATAGYTLTGTGAITLASIATVTATGNTVIGNNMVIGSGLVFSPSAGILQLDGVLSGGTTGFQKTGAGILKLTGSSTFSGNVVVSDGTLLATNTGNVGMNGSLGTSDSIVLDGGTIGIVGWTLGVGTDRSFYVNNGKVGVINVDAGGSSFREHMDIRGINTVPSTGSLVVAGTASSRQVFMNGSWAYSGGITIDSDMKGFNFSIVAPLASPLRLARQPALRPT